MAVQPDQLHYPVHELELEAVTKIVSRRNEDRTREWVFSARLKGDFGPSAVAGVAIDLGLFPIEATRRADLWPSEELRMLACAKFEARGV